MRKVSFIIAVATFAIAGKAANAQSSYRRILHDGFATRAELESLATDADRAVASGSLSGQSRSEKEATAFVVRQRLKDGDFQPGDRLAIVLDGAVKLSDTVVVRSGRTIVLPDLPEISLAGVLRSELQSYLTTQLRKYIRDPQLQTRPLIRVAVSGAVGRPGFYSIPADGLLSDLVTQAGGPGPRVEFSKSSIRRGSEVLWNGSSVVTALSDGLTIDALLLQSGDEVVIGERRQVNWLSVVQAAATVGGLASLLYTLTRRR
jgi:protein involved in polysaccharide export with SLBB domain